MEKDIIFDNKEFKVVSYQKGDEPVNIAIVYPEHNSVSRFLMTNGLDVLIDNPFDYYASTMVYFSFKNVCLEERKLGTKVSLCDLMNYYYNLNKTDLERIYEEVQKQTKSALVSEIELLKNKKIDLEQRLIELEEYFKKFTTDTAAILNEKG